MFIGKGTFEYEYEIDYIHDFAITFAFLGVIVLIAILLMGHWLNNQAKPDPRMLICYASMVMILGIIPFFGEAGILSTFHKLEEKDVNRLCNTINDVNVPSKYELTKFTNNVDVKR